MRSPPTPATGDAPRPLRRDAERNRLRILDAASEVFAARGLGATMDHVAAQAGVGVGTVYRRFPDKETLIQALFEQRIEELVGLAHDAHANPDPWEGLAGFLERVNELQAADRGLKELMLGTANGRACVALARERLAPITHDLIARAQAAGALRPDIGENDIPMLNMMLGAIVDFTRDVAPDLWRRYLGIVLDGLRARPDVPPLEPAALGERPLEDAMTNWRPGRPGR